MMPCGSAPLPLVGRVGGGGRASWHCCAPGTTPTPTLPHKGEGEETAAPYAIFPARGEGREGRMPFYHAAAGVRLVRPSVGASAIVSRTLKAIGTNAAAGTPVKSQAMPPRMGTITAQE
jgi:hypothetical protein